jgi:hypothetical protein
VPPDIIPSPRLPSPHTTGFKSLTQALNDAPSIRVRRHPRLPTFPRSMMPLVLSWHPSCRQCSRLLLTLDASRYHPPIHPFYDSLFDLSNACLALKIVPMFPSTQLFSPTTFLDPIEFPSTTLSPTFQKQTISSTFDNLDTIARKTRAYL